MPFAFTEQGIAMLSSILRTERAVDINIAIMRAFVRIRKLLSTHDELADRVQKHDRQIAMLWQHLQKLLEPP